MTRQPFDPRQIADSSAEPTSRGPLSVSQLTTLIQQALRSALPATVHVVGEISNLKRHAGGHTYWTLKDAHSELSCIMWRSDAAKLKFEPSDGLSVLAAGGVEVFEKSGRYQLYVRRLEPRGTGALDLAFRQLCDRLRREGLFDPARKRRIPHFPRRIVLVTSPSGAALHDMLTTLERRFPCAEVWHYPVRVQGRGAAEEIAGAIRRLSEQASTLGGVDVLIVGRGGGSQEDLWAFNEEIVARAIHASRIPVISAVGHEVDITIADLVADVRAPTPTAAAELAVPVRDDVEQIVTGLWSRITRVVTGRVQWYMARVEGLRNRVPLSMPDLMVGRRMQVIDELERRLEWRISRRLNERKISVDRASAIVSRGTPVAVLLRSTARLGGAESRLTWSVRNDWIRTRERLSEIIARMERYPPRVRVGEGRRRVERATASMRSSVKYQSSLLLRQVDRFQHLLRVMSYKSVLQRGYSITRLKRGGGVVRSPSQVRRGDRLLTELVDGQIESQVLDLRQLELFE